MINILFFASYRESLGTDSIQIEYTGPCTVNQIIEKLSAKSDTWQKTLSKSNLKIALNQQMVDSNSLVEDGDELAFFPPVTGG